ncbi:hypothetical protein EYC84_005484 [Monilinia fructicola]|uniref:Uncharacterized protein n=1 Tax=Monilinia fructicola TaxID=38448 RepID=A0A5M9JXI8_MONFR|nr:hypothetical protein EYC84_005484 [Monilinia fructicola]
MIHYFIFTSITVQVNNTIVYSSTNPATFPCPTPKDLFLPNSCPPFYKLLLFPLFPSSSLILHRKYQQHFLCIYLSVYLPNFGSVAGIYNLSTILISGRINHSSIYSFERVSNDKSIHHLL